MSLLYLAMLPEVVAFVLLIAMGIRDEIKREW